MKEEEQQKQCLPQVCTKYRLIEILRSVVSKKLHIKQIEIKLKTDSNNFLYFSKIILLVLTITQLNIYWYLPTYSL